MTPLLAARAQMDVSLAFHMVFAALGIGLPLLLLIAEGLWLKTGKPHYKKLARTWAKATALTFAIGAVSGTALSFELGLLWPKFMEVSGATLGGAFTLEGFAFFIEAIFIGLYLYGWERLSPRAHWLTTIPIAVSGLMSGILVVAANAWMQAPTSKLGIANADPFAPFRSPAWIHMSLHSSLSCYIATSFAVAGVYALGLLRGRKDEYHASGFAIAMAVAIPAALLQPLSGDVSARAVARLQPAKLAASEALYETQTRAPIKAGPIEIPAMLSILAHHDPNAKVIGLDSIPADQHPNVAVIHTAFQVMVGAGFAMVGVGLLYILLRRRRREQHPLFLKLVVAAAPLGFIALEAGWMVTEVGRQPWIIYQQMRTSEAVTTATNITSTLFGFTALYAGLGTILVLLLLRLRHHRAH